MIYVENKKKSLKSIANLYPDAEVIDVTSKGIFPFVKFSPFYPHGNIPIPFSQNYFGKSVEGIWQGLKVFEFEDIDSSKFEIEDMKGIKRTVRKFGKPLGHRKGIYGHELLDYLSARKQIYLPTYAWVLQNIVTKEIDLLIDIAKRADLVLLDYETNCDIDNVRKPLSHAGLIKKYIDKKHPEIATVTFSKSITKSKSVFKAKSEGNKTKTNTRKMLQKKNTDNKNDGQLNINFN